MRATLVIAALLTAGSSLAAAQSLADVAKAEEARRKTVDKPSKIYTNGDLKSDFTTPGVPAVPPPSMTGNAPPAGAAAQSQAGTTATAAPAKTPDAAAAPQRDQAYWKARIDAARMQLDRSRMFQEALQSRINALTTDVVNRDDPFQRAVLEQDRLKALAELERVKKEIDDHTKAIAAIEEEARRAGVPPGWLR